MKSERRHELKTNTLAKGIEGLPGQWREYGGRILLGILIFAIVFLLMRYWRDKKINDAATVVNSMETVNADLQALKMLPGQLAQGASSADIADTREKLAQQIDQSVTTVLTTTSDKKTLANAYLARGDMNWALADFPELPGADTQPSLRLPNRDSLMDQAATSYQKVLEPAYAANVDDKFYARLGLAAIAENHGKWDQAKSQFQSIADSSTMPPSYKDYASARVAELQKYQSTPLLVEGPRPAPEPSAPPATGPASAPQPLGPARPATSQPAALATPAHAQSEPATIKTKSAPTVYLHDIKPATTQPASKP